MDYGWLGFASWAIMIGWTIAGRLPLLFRDRPWQPYLLCAYVVFVGHVFLGTIIDTDHWRHFYLLLGMIWGCHRAGIPASAGTAAGAGTCRGGAGFIDSDSRRIRLTRTGLSRYIATRSGV